MEQKNNFLFIILPLLYLSKQNGKYLITFGLFKRAYTLIL